MTDKEYLLERIPNATEAKMHDFIERVGIKEDSGIDEETARREALEEFSSG